MPTRRRRSRRDPETEAHREFINVRRAALKVAEWEHRDDEAVKAAKKVVDDALNALESAENDRRAKKDAVQLAEDELVKALEKFIPEELRASGE